MTARPSAPRRIATVLALGAGALLALVACKKVLGLGSPDPYETLPDVASTTDAETDAEVIDARVAPDGRVCGTNLVTDPHNCGTCGHDCLGGECQARRCVPLKIGDSHDVTGVFAVHDNGIYVSDSDKIVRIDADGTRTTIAQDIGSMPNAILADAAHVVWSSDSAGFRGCPIKGCPGLVPTQISAAGKATRSATALPGSTRAWPYVWVGENSLQTYGALAAVSFTPASNSEAQCAGLTADDTFAFFADFMGNRISVIKKTDVSATVIGSFPTSYPCAITTHAKRVFWSDTKSVWRAQVDADGAISAAIALASDNNVPGSLVADDDYLYWSTTSFDGVIFRCAVAGCGGNPDPIVTGTPLVPRLALEGPWLYFSISLNETSGTQFWRVAR